MIAIGVLLATSLIGQAAASEPGESPAERLEFMKNCVKNYTIKDKENRDRGVVLQSEPAFRLGKQGDGVVLDGVIFLWVDPSGPARKLSGAGLQDAKRRALHLGLWSSVVLLARTRQLVARTAMDARSGTPRRPASSSRRSPSGRARRRPERAGSGRCVTSRRISLPARPAARGSRLDRPAITPEQSDLPLRKARDQGDRRWPSSRSSMAPTRRSFLFLEVRQGAAGKPQWQYAIARMTIFAVKASQSRQPDLERPGDGGQRREEPLGALFRLH